MYVYIYLFIRGNDPAVSGNQTWVAGKSPIFFDDFPPKPVFIGNFPATFDYQRVVLDESS
jgi:hypothetical protein